MYRKISDKNSSRGNRGTANSLEKEAWYGVKLDEIYQGHFRIWISLIRSREPKIRQGRCD